MKTYFHANHARKTCITVYRYLNLLTGSQRYRKLWDFSERNSSGSYIDIAVLDQCCCTKNIAMRLWIFFMNFLRWHEEGTIIHQNKTIILRYSGIERWRQPSLRLAEDWSSGKNISLKTACKEDKFLKTALYFSGQNV